MSHFDFRKNPNLYDQRVSETAHSDKINPGESKVANNSKPFNFQQQNPNSIPNRPKQRPLVHDLTKQFHKLLEDMLEQQLALLQTWPKRLWFNFVDTVLDRNPNGVLLCSEHGEFGRWLEDVVRDSILDLIRQVDSNLPQNAWTTVGCLQYSISNCGNFGKLFDQDSTYNGQSFGDHQVVKMDGPYCTVATVISALREMASPNATQAAKQLQAAVFHLMKGEFKTAITKDTKDKDTARNRTRPKRSSSKSKSNTNTNTNTNNSSSKHSTEFQIPGGDKAGPATEIILLRQEYVRKFGKKPRGRSSSDVNWLRAKLSGDVPPPLSPVNESGSMETNRLPGTFDPMSPMHQEATEWKESLHSMEEASHMGSIVDMNIPDPTEARNNNSENGNGENQVMRERTIDDPNASSVSGSSSTSTSTSSSSLSSSSATSATSATSTTSSTSTSDDLLNGSRNNNMEGSTTPNTEGRNTVNGSGIVVDWTNVDQHEDSSFLMSGIMPIPVDGNSQETNLYARLAAGASSWLLAKDTVPSNSSNNNYNNGDTDSNDNNYSTSNSQSSSLSAPNSHKATPAMSPSRRPSDPSSMTTTKVPASSSSSSSSTTLPKATNHQFGASLDSAYQDKTAYLNFNTKRTTSNGQTIQVCDLNPNGVKQQPWEQRRNVTTDNGNSKTFNSSSSSTSSKHTKNNDNSTSSDKWYELPEQELTPDVRRELEIVKMRNYLNPKRFYKANDSKTLPTRFQFGTIISGQFERNSETLTRAERKNTIAESLMHDRKTRKYTKRVFDQVQDERKLPKSNKRRKQHGRR